MKKQKIALYGFGYVGQAIYRFLRDHYEVKVYDPAYFGMAETAEDERVSFKDVYFVKEYEALADCECGIICVPTPDKDGKCDISIVEETIKKAPQEYFLIKSTIPPGTTEKLQTIYGNIKIAFSPEYIGEGKYAIPFWKYPHPTDMKLHKFQIFGGRRKVTNYFVEIFQRVLGPDCQYMQTDSNTAELCKYMENAWGATKVTFCNEFFEIAKAFGVDYRELRELWLLDTRVERMHTSVFENARGWGGKCYPKDVNAIIAAAEEAGYEPELLKKVVETNKKHRGEK